MKAILTFLIGAAIGFVLADVTRVRKPATWSANTTHSNMPWYVYGSTRTQRGTPPQPPVQRTARVE